MKAIFGTKPSPLEDDVEDFPGPLAELRLVELFEGSDWISGSALSRDPRPRPRPRTGLGRPDDSPEWKPLDEDALKLFLNRKSLKNLNLFNSLPNSGRQKFKKKFLCGLG